MISRNQLKLIQSLSQKKYRQKHELFVVEGVKGVQEFLKSSFILHSLYTTDPLIFNSSTDVIVIDDDTLKKISTLKTPNKVVAIFKMPNPKPIKEEKLIVALDAVNDPGNLGTIIRLCDWFGIKDLVCSKQSVDCYNTKVVQATMGSLTRVNINYVDLPEFLSQTQLTVFGTYMDGDNIYKSALPESGVLVMGNEANGISDNVSKIVTSRLAIPRFGDLKSTESLNVATATAILLSEFKR